MGYDVHITRKEDWFEEGDDISIEEWKAYLKDDKDMRLDNYAKAQVGEGETLRVESDGLAVWTAYSGHEEGGNMAWFDYQQGNITVKNPDDEILNKMIAISHAFNAKVQGDDGETYPIQEVPVNSTPSQSTGSFLTLVIGGGVIIVVAIILILLRV